MNTIDEEWYQYLISHLQYTLGPFMPINHTKTPIVITACYAIFTREL